MTRHAPYWLVRGRVKRLLALHHQGLTSEGIALKMGTSARSVSSKLVSLGYSPKSAYRQAIERREAMGMSPVTLPRIRFLELPDDLLQR